MSKVIKELSCELNEEERNQRAGELALAINDLDAMETEKKDFNANWKERKTDLDKRVHRLADARNLGTELRDVSCTERYNRATRQIDMTRDDTGAHVLSRALEDGERQTDAFEDDESGSASRGRH